MCSKYIKLLITNYITSERKISLLFFSRREYRKTLTLQYFFEKYYVSSYKYPFIQFSVSFSFSFSFSLDYITYITLFIKMRSFFNSRDTKGLINPTLNNWQGKFHQESENNHGIDFSRKDLN